MTEDEFQDELDEMLAAFCAEVSDSINETAEKLGLSIRVWYVNVVNGSVVALRWRYFAKPRLFGPHPGRTAPGNRPWL